jgi:hypothetical protein
MFPKVLHEARNVVITVLAGLALVALAIGIVILLVAALIRP